MKYKIDGNDILLYEKNLSLSETLDCGQAFRWKEDEEKNGYKGFAKDKFLHIVNDEDCVRLKNTTEEDFLNFWVKYFDLDTDYSLLKENYAKDETLKKACEYASGIRLLRQDSWEALCSFIISQNNNIPRIKGIVERLCESFGEETENGFTFPTAEKIASCSLEDLAPLRAGFRGKYILDAAKKVATKEVDLEKVIEMPKDEGQKELLKILGVGVKVADCTLLYGMYKIESFPVDVWIKRVLEEYYPQGLPDCIKGSEGIAQQFLFHYVRNI